MVFSDIHIVLGSRSPQRRALLEQLLNPDAITICPPRCAEEPGFEGLSTWGDVETRLMEIARAKSADVLEQCLQDSRLVPHANPLILTADTVIVAGEDPAHIVLGQPPEPNWRLAARAWFLKYLLDKTHRAATAVCLVDQNGRRCERFAVSEVTFAPYDRELLEWYLDTEEPRCKAGGYAIQGAGSLFVSELKGSLSNVIGLPLLDVWKMLAEFQNAL